MLFEVTEHIPALDENMCPNDTAVDQSTNMADDVRRSFQLVVAKTMRTITHQFKDLFLIGNFQREEIDLKSFISFLGPPAVPIIDYYRYLNWTEFVFRWNINPPNNGFPTQYIAWYKTR